MAQCLARSQTFSQFIRPSSLLSYTSKSNSWKAMIGKGLNAMPALLKFLVLLALFLSVHHANAFISLTSVAQIKCRSIIWLVYSNQLVIQGMNQVANQFTNQPNKWIWMMCFLLNSDSLKGSSVKVITYLWMICFGFTWKPYAANLPRGDLKSLIVKIACLAIVCSFRT